MLPFPQHGWSLGWSRQPTNSRRITAKSTSLPEPVNTTSVSQPEPRSVSQPVKSGTITSFIEKNQGILAVGAIATSCYGAGFAAHSILSELQISQVTANAKIDVLEAEQRAQAAEQRAKIDVLAAEQRAKIDVLEAEQRAQAAEQCAKIDVLAAEQRAQAAEQRAQTADLRKEHAQGLLDIVFHSDYEKYRDTVPQDKANK